MRVQSWAEFSRAVKAGATAGRVAGTVVARTERRTRTGSKMGIIGLSDPTGHYEAVIFSEGLAEYRDLLEPGTAVLLFLSAEVQGDEVRARIQSVEPLDAGGGQSAEGPARVPARSRRRSRRSPSGWSRAARRPIAANGDGEVSMVLMLERGTEVEVKLPGRFKVSPQIAGAIKAVPGVVQVEALVSAAGPLDMPALGELSCACLAMLQQPAPLYKPAHHSRGRLALGPDNGSKRPSGGPFEGAHTRPRRINRRMTNGAS